MGYSVFHIILEDLANNKRFKFENELDAVMPENYECKTIVRDSAGFKLMYIFNQLIDEETKNNLETRLDRAKIEKLGIKGWSFQG